MLAHPAQERLCPSRDAAGATTALQATPGEQTVHKLDKLPVFAPPNNRPAPAKRAAPILCPQHSARLFLPGTKGYKVPSQLYRTKQIRMSSIALARRALYSRHFMRPPPWPHQFFGLCTCEAMAVLSTTTYTQAERSRLGTERSGILLQYTHSPLTSVLQARLYS